MRMGSSLNISSGIWREFVRGQVLHFFHITTWATDNAVSADRP